MGLLSAGARGGNAVETAAAPGACVLGPGRSAHRAVHGSTTFVLTTEWVDSDVPIVSVSGELDLATAPALEEALLALHDHAEGVIVDLTRCDFIDLRGLHVLLTARELLQASSQTLSLVVPNTSLLRVFTITRVEDLFAIYPSMTAAMEPDGQG